MSKQFSSTSPLQNLGQGGHRITLVDDQDRLEELSSGLYEALGQVLRVAREIQVEHNSLVDVEAMIKTTLDDAWAKQVAGRLKGKVLPATLGFVKVLLSSPLTAEIVKTWLAQ